MKPYIRPATDKEPAALVCLEPGAFPIDRQWALTLLDDISHEAQRMPTHDRVLDSADSPDRG